MVLAAGLATKLKPLSLKKPKALFPVANLTSIERVIKLIDGYGFKEAVVNLHSQGEQIEEFLGGGSRYGISLSYSWEKKIMGTAGALAKARNFFDNETFLVINSDVLTTINLKKALDFHRNREALATLILTRADTSEYGAVGIDEEERIKSFLGKSYNLPVQGLKSEAVYTGIAFFEP
ncbi:MAG: nucleotidyltransferase family protein, partial [Candidatus Subteraquimicrobiales bacterium]|nr:nucleotidyltransferase family protein [Candidatus Subteraquimicrobiales bacterium]